MAALVWPLLTSGCHQPSGEAGALAPLSSGPVQTNPGRRDQSTTPGSTAQPETGCAVEVRALVERRADGTLRLWTEMFHRNSGSVELTWRTSCPGPEMTYDGLGPNYDYGRACTMGSCAAGTSQEHRLALGPYERKSLGDVELSPRGDACNGALPVGTASVWPAASLSGASICGVQPATFRIEAPTAPQAPAPAQVPAPARPPAPTPKQDCPAMACRYEPCPPGVLPPTGCMAVCGCAGRAQQPPGIAPR